MRIAAVLLGMTCAVACIAADKTDKADKVDLSAGKQVFDRRCAACHAPGLDGPGTQRLGWDRGADYAVLEQRKDLTAPYVQFVVRHGLREMPAFRPTEITDEQLTQLSAYLAKAGQRTRK